MTLTVDAAETFLAERHYTVAKQLGITEQTAQPYLDEEALDALADRLVATFAIEEPGADLFAFPRQGSTRPYLDRDVTALRRRRRRPHPRCGREKPALHPP